MVMSSLGSCHPGRVLGLCLVLGLGLGLELGLGLGLELGLRLQSTSKGTSRNYLVV